WQDGGIPPKLQAGKERCVVRAGSYGSLENCGSFYSADGLLRDLQTNSAVRIEKLPSRYRLEDAANIADQVTRFNYLATWQGREETPDQFWKALWWAFVATSIAALLAMGVFRL